MAWTAPLDWSNASAVPSGIVTAAMLNEQIRDNLGVLSTHTHTGAAGMGATTMSGLTLTGLVNLTFADEGAPTSAGELQRDGIDLKFYGSSAVNLTAINASAGTGSLRTLALTATSAAAGNHTHVPASPNQLIQAVSGYVNSDDETTVGTGTIAVQGASEALAVFAAVSLPDGKSARTIRLKYSRPASGTVGTVTGQTAGTTGVVAVPASGTAGIITPTTAGTYTVIVTIQRTTTGGTPHVNARGQYYAREVGA